VRQDILDFLKLAHKRLGVEAYYIPDGDIYVVTKCQKAVQNFTSDKFYQIPKWHRLNEWYGMIKLGLNQNMGEKTLHDQIQQTMSFGKKIYLHG